MHDIDYLQARLWEAIQTLDQDRDSYSTEQLITAFNQLQALSNYVKLRIVQEGRKPTGDEV